MGIVTRHTLVAEYAIGIDTHLIDESNQISIRIPSAWVVFCGWIKYVDTNGFRHTGDYANGLRNRSIMIWIVQNERSFVIYE